LFWEQYSHEPYIAVCRFQMFYLGKSKEAREGWRVERGERALDLMQSALDAREFLASDAFTIADIPLLAYTRLAREGGFDLSMRPDVLAWIGRCEKELGLAPAAS
jgi:glutathione S-transferase